MEKQCPKLSQHRNTQTERYWGCNAVLALGFPMCTVALFIVFSCQIEKLCLLISPTYYAKNCVAYVHFDIVLYPGKGVCADPVNGSAILGKGRLNPHSRDRVRQLAPDKGREKTWSIVRMRRRREDKEDDPLTASECQHAQSKLMCIAGRWRVNLLLMYIGMTI